MLIDLVWKKDRAPTVEEVEVMWGIMRTRMKRSITCLMMPLTLVLELLFSQIGSDIRSQLSCDNSYKTEIKYSQEGWAGFNLPNPNTPFKKKNTNPPEISNLHFRILGMEEFFTHQFMLAQFSGRNFNCL